ncbi:MAG: transglycosylase SLT domain-containing protein, partial [Desulfobacterales bacterium]|nr:transglycosylase SLT domain-containing protein [Desulfobacterales bacterium]
VIHDKRYLNRIYGVIDLVDPYRTGGRKINNKRIKKAKKKYKSILRKLLQGKAASGPLEKRVAGLFGSDTQAADFRLALRNIRCQTGQKDRFRAGVIRSGAYLKKIKQIFREAGLPEDLAYLPHVESSFNPRAYSKFGAAGIWQFTRSTGKHYMKVGYTIDERRDPIMSSHAAAKLLRHNYRKLENWPMAITAYNHGISGMLRARRSRGSYENIFKRYRSRIFKFASRNFYSEFLAAREAAVNYRQYFGDLNLDTPIRTQEMVLAGYVSIPEVAQQLKLDLILLQKLNPALRHPVFRGQKYVPAGYRLQLPNRSDKDWQISIARLPQVLYRPNQKRSHIYTVRRGDTAGKIAKNHGVLLRDLIAANNLDARATVYVDQNIRIPLPDNKAALLAEHKPRNSETKTKIAALDSQSKEKKTAGHAIPESNLLSANSSKRVPDYADKIKRFAIGKGKDLEVVESNSLLNAEDEPEPNLSTVVAEIKSDNVQEKTAEKKTNSAPAGIDSGAMDIIADRADQAPKLQMANLETDPIQLVDLWQLKATNPTLKVNPEIVLEQLAVKRVVTRRGKPVGAIQVEVEETLGHYAEWLGTKASQIRQLNGLSYGRTLHLNQKLKIPLHRVTKEEFEEKRFEYHQELAEDFFASYRIEKVLTYIIKRGDNVWTLSHQEFEVPLWLIKRYNAGVDFNALIPSQELLIPVIEKNA